MKKHARSPFPAPSEFAPREKPHEDNIARGVVYGLIAVFLFAVMQLCGKVLSEHHTVIEVAFYRSLVAIVPLTIYVLATRQTHLLITRKPVSLFFRVVIGFTGVLLTFGAFALLPMSEATVIIMTTALIAPAMAFFILKEYIGPHRWAAIIIGLVGVTLMVGPTGSFPYIGAIVAFSAAIFQAGVQIFLRHLKTESSFTVTYYFILGGGIIGGLCMPFIAVTPTAEEWPYIIGIGVTGGAAQYFFTSAMRYAPNAVISPLNYTGLIWASLFDIALWKYYPGVSVYIGACIIIASQGYILHREKIRRNRP